MPSIPINGKSLYYTHEQSPTPSKTTIVFIHGLGSSHCFFKTITPNISLNSSCYLLDTPGSGRSEPGLGKQTLETIVKDVIGLLDSLAIKEKVVLVGHSMGCIVASAIAAEYAGRVKGVVLLGPVDPSEMLKEAFGKRIEVVRKEGVEVLANTVPRAATGSKAGPLQYAFIRSLILGTTDENYMCLCDVIANAKRPDYEAIKVPLLILAGGEDKTAPLSGAEGILEAYGTEGREKRIEILKGVGHWHCIEAPEDVATHISKFVKGFE